MKQNFLKSILLLLVMASIMHSCSQPAVMEEVAPKHNGGGVSKASTPTLKTSDSLALVAIYDALGGKKWSRPNLWKRRPVRMWEGVTIESVNGEKRVTELRLGMMNLNGKLPKEIKNLTELKALEMCYNAKLKGDIIEEVYELENLVTLNLRFTGITGRLSPSIGKLAKLDTLDLWTSQWILEVPGWDKNPDVMTGELPKELGELKNLRFLRLGRQAFTGDLPTEIGEMEALSFFDIAQCQFSGAIPASLGKLKNLQVLFAGWNKFTSIPREICDAGSLRQIFVNNNALAGNIPADIGKLKELTHLSLEHNTLTGRIPDLSQMPQLGILYLQNNRLTGEIPSSIGSNKHPQMIVANLSDNNLTGIVPPREAHYWNGGAWWTKVIVKGNRLSGAVDQSHLNAEEVRQRFLPQQEGYGFDNLK